MKLTGIVETYRDEAWSARVIAAMPPEVRALLARLQDPRWGEKVWSGYGAASAVALLRTGEAIVTASRTVTAIPKGEPVRITLWVGSAFDRPTLPSHVQMSLRVNGVLVSLDRVGEIEALLDIEERARET